MLGSSLFSFLISVTLVYEIISLHSGFPAAVANFSPGANETDGLALLAFKTGITRDPLQIMRSWNKSFHFCQWHGVTCSRRHQRVTVLHLPSQQLVGSISPQIGNMSFLRILNLHDNGFSGDIPQEIGRLFRLQRLGLENNSFEGDIPGNISFCSRLIYLGLGGNKLMGKVPAEFGSSLSKLEVLSLYSNNLTGEIPHSFGNFSFLQIFYASRNNFEGRIPDTLGQLTNLIALSLGLNKLSGTIPPSMFNLSSIASFSVPLNYIHGTLPADIGLTFPSIKNLNIHTNQFSGIIPVSIANSSNLVALSIARNQFTGKVPSLAKLHNLQEVAMHFNHLGNGGNDDLNFLISLANSSSVEYLSLSDNNFGGMLPISISNFSTKLRNMGLGRNRIHGSIPSGIGNLVSLEVLGLETNHLTGGIPQTIGRLQNMKYLYLNDNKLSGNIPSSMGNLSLLDLLVLESNQIQGSIPSSLGNLQYMTVMILSQNNLSGAIPKEVFSISSLSIALDLSRNYLIGSLPLEVGNLINLGYLDVSENKLSGEIPSSFGSCISLESLYLQGNFFQGTIPPSLSSLRGIQVVDLSRNNFTGKIPDYLEKFVFLQNLNLSFNDFEGQLLTKGVFQNASAVSIIGNKKLCGGIPKMLLPKCRVENEESNKDGLSLELKLVISSFSLLGLSFVVFFLRLYWVRKRRGGTSTNSLFDGLVLHLSYERLLKATDGFSPANLIGVGSFGSVYKGILQMDERVVAIKVLNLQRRGAHKSFMAECEALKNIRHRNLVKIITVCSSVDFQGNDFKALVYEFMVKGSLEEWLHPIPIVDGEDYVESRNLTLLQRLDIAIDIARALDYLHYHCQTPVLHCDLKPSNVLLDSDMTAHVGDFGLARFLPQISHGSSSANQTSSIGIRGSVGYAAPEYGMGSEVSTNGDVYSYGIILLEMFTGKRPTDDMFTNNLNLHNYAKMALPEQVIEIVDPVLLHSIEGEVMDGNDADNKNYARISTIRECLILVVRIGVACSSELPRDRMDIADVARELHLVKHTVTQLLESIQTEEAEGRISFFSVIHSK